MTELTTEPVTDPLLEAGGPGTLGTTPSQTVGPFLSIVLPWPDGPDVLSADTPGGITLLGRLTDGGGDPVPDGVIEIWQADPDGRFAHADDPRGASTYEGFRGFGRCPTEADGSFHFRTLVPGPVPDADGEQAPHIDVSVFCRGLLNRLVTRVYFPGEPLNDTDPLLASLPPQTAQALIAERVGEGTYRLDIRLRGDGETPFFEL